MANKKIYWDAGHGGSDPGAVGNGLKEKDLAIKVVNYAVAYMEKTYTCDVYKDITADSLNTITARANKWGATLVISVHFNAGGGDGYEALVYSSANKDLGQTFEKYVKAVGQNSRGVKYRPDLAILRDTNCKAILNEIAFIDTKKDIKDWDEDKELKVMGEALAKAAADYLGLKKKTTSSTGSSTSSKKEFKVKIKVDSLNIRKSASLDAAVVGHITDKGVYTIVEETSDNWGKLKSGAGWIRTLDKYVTKL